MLHTYELDTPGYLEALNGGSAIGGFLDDLLGLDDGGDSGGGDPAATPSYDSGGDSGDIQPYYPTRSDQNVVNDPQWAGDADLLASIGYGYGSGGYTGKGDPGWTATVQAFQSDAHLTVDGVMGPKTRAAAQSIYAQQQAGGGIGPAPDPGGGGTAPAAPGGGTLPIEPASDTSPNYVLYGIAAVAGVIVVGLLLTGGKKKGKKRAR